MDIVYNLITLVIGFTLTTVTFIVCVHWERHKEVRKLEKKARLIAKMNRCKEKLQKDEDYDFYFEVIHHDKTP